MYEHTESAVAAAGCFDPNPNGLPTEGAGSAAGDHGFYQSHNNPFTPSLFLMDEAKDEQQQHHHQHQQDQEEEAPVEVIAVQQLQNRMAFNDMGHCCFSTNSSIENHPVDERPNWPINEDSSSTAFNLSPFQNQDQTVLVDHHHLDLDQTSFNLHATSNGTAPTTDLLNLLHLPRLPSPSISFANPFQKPGEFSSSLGFLDNIINPTTTGDSSIPHDHPLFHLNLPPTQPPLFRDLMFQPFSGSHVYGQLRGSSLYGPGPGPAGGLGIDHEGEAGSGGGYLQDQIPLGDGSGGGVFEFARDDMGGNCVGKGKDSKCPKNFVTERQRRVNLNDKYQHLKGLVPSPTKGDRASIVGDAIEYIKELNRSVNELKHLVEKKRCSKERIKRHKAADDDGGAAGGGGGRGAGDVESPAGDCTGGVLVKSEQQVEQSFNGSTSALRSSWLQRKCKDTEVDVRIIDDEVTIKLVQRKKISCILLYVSMTLDELQLDLRHVAGGHCGDYYSFLFNTKIYEGSSVYASAIANRLIEVVDRQYAAAAISPTATY